jgi:hypothetical protein
MAGTLYHGRGFEKKEYHANDGFTHYEVSPIDGGMEVVSISSWNEIQAYCEMRGIARSTWPDYADAFDVPLDDVQAKSAQKRKTLCMLPPEDIAQFHWLEKLVTYLSRGESFFFAE